MSKKPPKFTPTQIISSKEAVERMQYISDLDQEVVLLITLDGRYRIIDEHLMSVGTMDESNTDIRLLFNRILIDKAQKFFVGHNHPTSEAYFSNEDIAFAARLKCISKFLSLEMLDFILFPYKKNEIYMSKRHRKFWAIKFNEIIAETLYKKINIWLKK